MDLRLRPCLSDDSTQQMAVSLTLLIIIPIVMIVTIIARVADDERGCGRRYKQQEPCARAPVSVRAPEFLGNL